MTGFRGVIEVRLTEGVDRRENGEFCVNIDPMNNVMLSMVPGVLEHLREKVQGIKERIDIPRPLGEPDERNETSNILREVDHVLDTVIPVAKNEPSDNVMLSIVPGMLKDSQKNLRGVIRRLDIPIPLGEPDERNKVSRLLCIVVGFLEMAREEC